LESSNKKTPALPSNQETGVGPEIMKILVTWYRDTGKYYSSGEVEIDCAQIWEDDLKQQIIDHQEVMRDGWQSSNYFVVTQDIDVELATFEKANPGKTAFHWHLYLPGAFAKFRRQNSNK